jgi:isocitrate lyase
MNNLNTDTNNELDRIGCHENKISRTASGDDRIRPYSDEDVKRLRGSFKIEYTLARLGAERLRRLLREDNFVAALGALTGNQAVQQVKAGLKAIYLSGWQVAADANLAGQMYPDQKPLSGEQRSFGR